MKKLFLAALLAVSPAALHAQTPQPEISIGPASTVLSINAEGETRRTPDIAMFSAGVVTQSATASGAIRDNSARMSAVVAALRQAGIAEHDIQTSTISLNPVFTNPDRDAMIRARELGQPLPPEANIRRIVGYEARNTVQVRVRNLANMGRVIDTLVSVGANEINGPNFTLDQHQAALDEARLDAVTKGRQRAELYARAAGLRVARILSISETGGYHPMRESIMVTGARMDAVAPPPPPVAPGELTLGVNVTMQFELVR
jgi:uncharacterized protein